MSKQKYTQTKKLNLLIRKEKNEMEHILLIKQILRREKKIYWKANKK